MNIVMNFVVKMLMFEPRVERGKDVDEHIDEHGEIL